MSKKMSKKQRRRVAIWSFVTIVGVALLLPLGSQTVYWLSGAAHAQTANAAAAVNERSNMWRAVREGVSGTSSIKGDGANVLIQSGGNAWRDARENKVVKALPWMIVGMLVLLLLYHLLHGRNRIDHELSGRKVKRWNGFERVVHWITAFSFIALAITGLSMLFGKAMLSWTIGGSPVISKAAFAAWAQISIQVHNIIGPVFCVGIVLMIVMWIWHNIPTVTDLKWFAQGGGLFGKAHPSAGRMNGGEKVWFWLLATLGVVVCITGVIMVAPLMGWTLPESLSSRGALQQSNLLHGILAVIWTTVALGHIYIGTAGTEGALEGMSTGYVSEEWAKQHHDLWYKKVANKGDAGGYVDASDLEIMEEENDKTYLGTSGYS